MKKVQLEIIALSHGVSANQTYAILLRELGGSRTLHIIIGIFEAQAINVALEKVHTSRPLTHDLLKNLIENFGYNVREILINNLAEGIFYSKLCLENENGEIKEIDSRTSDALALAVRFNCPIYTYEHIIESVSQNVSNVIDDNLPLLEELMETITNPNDLTNLSIEELQQKLEEALLSEDYQFAAELRDELNNRQNKS